MADERLRKLEALARTLANNSDPLHPLNTNPHAIARVFTRTLRQVTTLLESTQALVDEHAQAARVDTAHGDVADAGGKPSLHDTDMDTVRVHDAQPDVSRAKEYQGLVSLKRKRYPLGPYMQALQDRSFALDQLVPIEDALRGCILAAASKQPTVDTAASRRVLERAIAIMAQENGLQYYATENIDDGDSSGPTVTVCGSVVVVDIEFSVDNKVARVKLSSASEVDLVDPQTEALLTDMLRTRDLDAFGDTLKTLAFFDSFSGHTQIDLFQCMHAIEMDLRSIHSIEMNNVGQDVVHVACHGHGLPHFHIDKWGPSILYWCPPSDRAKLKDLVASNAFVDRTALPTSYRAFITMEDAPMTSFLPKHRAQYLVTPGDTHDIMSETDHDACTLHTMTTLLDTRLQFWVPRAVSDSSTAVTPRASFVFCIDPPVYITFDAASAISRLFYGDVDVSGVRSDTASTGLSLYEDVVLGENARQRTHQLQYASTCTTFTIKFSTPSPDVPQYAVRVSRIPFKAPSDMYTVLQTLRQHLVFEQISKSMCGDGAPGINNTSTTASDSVDCVLDVVEYTPPSTISVVLMYGVSPYMFRVTVRVPFDGGIMSTDTTTTGLHIDLSVSSSPRNDDTSMMSWSKVSLDTDVSARLCHVADDTIDLVKIVKSVMDILPALSVMN